MPRVPLLIALSLLAGCSGRAGSDAALNEEMAAIAEQRAPVPEKVFTDRWRQMFANPKAVVAAANDLGFLAGDYAAAGAQFRSDGAAQTAPRPGAPMTVVSDFAAIGSAAGQVDSIIFVFDITRRAPVDDRTEKELLKNPRRFVRGFLQRFQIGPDDRLIAGITAPKTVKFQDYGANVEVTDTKLPGGVGAGNHHLVVRLTRQGATPAAAPTPDIAPAATATDNSAQIQSARK